MHGIWFFEIVKKTQLIVSIAFLVCKSFVGLEDFRVLLYVGNQFVYLAERKSGVGVGSAVVNTNATRSSIAQACAREYHIAYKAFKFIVFARCKNVVASAVKNF